MQGQGCGTRRKEWRFKSCFRQSLLIAKNLPGVYTHIDLTSGCGQNEAAGCLGSPIEFVRLAMRIRRSSRVFCCDICPRAIERLRAELAQSNWPRGWPEVELEQADNAGYLAELMRRLREESRRGSWPYGTLVCDPNGPRSGYPRDLLAEFAAQFKRIDIIVTFNVNSYRAWDPSKSRGQRTEHTDRALATAMARYGTVAEDLERIGPERRWWISNPSKRGGTGNGYMVCLGRTMQKLTEPPDSDFVDAASERGQKRLRELRFDDGQLYFPYAT